MLLLSAYFQGLDWSPMHEILLGTLLYLEVSFSRQVGTFLYLEVSFPTLIAVVDPDGCPRPAGQGAGSISWIYEWTYTGHISSHILRLMPSMSIHKSPISIHMSNYNIVGHMNGYRGFMDWPGRVMVLMCLSVCLSVCLFVPLPRSLDL